LRVVKGMGAAGAGAAGGMGFALMSVCGAELKSGFDIVAGDGVVFCFVRGLGF
jgi:glycerate kinase